MKLSLQGPCTNEEYFLGFIGCILGPVIGVITSDDAEEYDEAINDIYEK